MIFSTPPISELVSTLEDPKSPIGKRMRAAYYCKQILSDSNNKKKNDNDNNDATNDDTNDNNDNVNLLMDILGKQLLNIHHGSLLRHEFAYILGQLQNPISIPVLEYVVSNSNECVMVRHEAAEALGAIASPSSIELLTNYSSDDDSPKELADTCLLSIKRIQQQQQNQSSKEEEIVACPCSTTPFSATIDPALISTTTTTTNENEESIEQLYMILSNPTIDIVERYRAMFTLRNRGAVESICQVLMEDKSSSLLRHELAFVLGQLQSPKSINCLLEILGRPNEHIMVRHEAAEALGAIEGCSSEEWELIENTLHSYQKDPIQAISESCIVALDAADYWGSSSSSSSQQQQSSHNDDDDEKKDHDDDGEEEEKDDGILLFRQQKNQTAGIPSSNNNNNNNIRREILNQHFNVATN